MSPQEASRLVGHSPQTRDIVDELRGLKEELGALACENEDMEDEIERLRTALRSVRASTDPKWQAQIISDALRESET